MIYLLLGGLAFWLLLRASGKPRLKRREWRFTTAAFAIAAFAGAAFAGLRREWAPMVVLLVMGAWLALSTRAPPGAAAGARPSAAMSVEEARSILGVSSQASREEIKAAYNRLMRAVHPDKGGSAGLAAQLNAARDRLLKR